MGEHIEEGDTCIIAHDILIEDRIAFHKGERVVVEDIDHDEQRPMYRYVVYSDALEAQARKKW